MAVKFHLPDGEATDIVSVPLVVFFARNAEDFLEMTRARIPDPETGQPDPEKVGAYLAEHPEAGVALQKAMPKLAPTTSFATSDYRALHAFCLVDAEGGTHWGRYTWEPEDGTGVPERRAGRRGRPRLPPGGDQGAAGRGHRPVHARVHPRERGRSARRPDVEWEGEHEVIELGELEVLRVVEDAETPGNPLVFDPMRLTDGIEPSDGPDPRRPAEGLQRLDRAPHLVEVEHERRVVRRDPAELIVGRVGLDAR